MVTTQDIYAPTLPQGRGKAILMMTGDNCHDLEFFYPYYRFCEAGFTVDVVTPKGGKLKGKFGMELQSTLAVEAINVQEYDLLYLPGGKAPEAMRKVPEIIEAVRAFVATGKPVAAICHGAQLLVTADAVRGKQIAAWPEVEEEITKAGGVFVNSALVEDGPFITARQPGDLPGHVAAVVARLGTAQKVRTAA